jgi:guanylate kinase
MAAATQQAIKLLVFSGPSGSGKSTLVTRLMAEFKDGFAFSISHTTRKPRPGETDGKDYYYVSREEMLKAIERNEFVEHAEFSGNIYGTSKKAISDVSSSGRICILDIDMQGVKSVKKTNLKPRYIFVKPPSIKTLEERLKGRGTETDDSLAKRLAAAKAEMEYAAVAGNYDHIIVNNDLDTAYAELKQILSKDLEEMTKGKKAS